MAARCGASNAGLLPSWPAFASAVWLGVLPSMMTSPPRASPPTATSATNFVAAPEEASVAIPPIAAPPPPPPKPIDASSELLRPTDGTTGRIAASALRWRITSARKSAQPAQACKCLRNGRRRSAPPVAVASCSRISWHGIARALRVSISEKRAWNTSDFTFAASHPTTLPTSACERPPTSVSTSAARWSNGKAWRSCSRSRRSARCCTCSDSPAVTSSSSSAGSLWRRRTAEKQWLRAIPYSHGLSLISRPSGPIAR